MFLRILADIGSQIETAGGDSTTVQSIVANVLDTIFGVMGIIAVIFIVMGGVYYMTAQGDPGKIKKAKDTILYSVVGLAIAVLAFAIVGFTLGKLGG